MPTADRHTYVHAHTSSPAGYQLLWLVCELNTHVTRRHTIWLAPLDYLLVARQAAGAPPASSATARQGAARQGQASMPRAP